MTTDYETKRKSIDMLDLMLTAEKCNFTSFYYKLIGNNCYDIQCQ